MFAGVLKRRCMDIETGIRHADDYMCGGRDCPSGYFCGKTNENPNFGTTNFDNIFYAFLTIFQTVTLEGWSEIMVQLQMTFNNLSFMFFVPLIFVGSFFLLNLTLAVIKSNYSEEEKLKKRAMRERE